MSPEIIYTPGLTKEKAKTAFIAVMITAVAAYALALISIDFFGLHGWSIFIATPVVCGFISVWIYNRKGNRPLGESLSVSGLSGGFLFLGFFVVGFEGLICLLMAAPIMLPLFFLGGWIGYGFSRQRYKGKSAQLLVLLLWASVPLLMGFESVATREPRMRKAVTTVVIEGSINQVWQEVIQFSPIPEPEEFIFRMGIAYPTDARIEGEGVGAVRYCNFSTGSFVEPITHWEKNRKLAFDVKEQPVPMTEISPYTGLHPPHLDWAIRSHKGQFLLKDLGDGRVELEGTTWFTTEMGPEPYWSWITGKLIHKIHKRVLGHIQTTVESP